MVGTLSASLVLSPCLVKYFRFVGFRLRKWVLLQLMRQGLTLSQRRWLQSSIERQSGAKSGNSPLSPLKIASEKTTTETHSQPTANPFKKCSSRPSFFPSLPPRLSFNPLTGYVSPSQPSTSYQHPYQYRDCLHEHTQVYEAMHLSFDAEKVGWDIAEGATCTGCV